MVLNLLNFSTLSQFFIVKSVITWREGDYKKTNRKHSLSVVGDGNIQEIKTVNDNAIIANINWKRVYIDSYLVQGLHWLLHVGSVWPVISIMF